jgi:hypothetical protein
VFSGRNQTRLPPSSKIIGPAWTDFFFGAMKR